MTRNETSTPKSPRPGHRADELVCTNCGGSLEPVGNRLFLMYKRAHLPQPSTEALVCANCGWVEGDTKFQALLEERINHR